MLPAVDNPTILQNLKEVTQPNFTYKIMIEDEKVSGDIDDTMAVWQACYKILNTERYRHVIYSWGYGVELADLFGKPIPYVYSELPRRIKEALMYDDRIKDVTDFQLSHKKNDVLAEFTVLTTAGTFAMSKGVTVGNV